jgi:hypothetical protein
MHGGGQRENIDEYRVGLSSEWLLRAENKARRLQKSAKNARGRSNILDVISVYPLNEDIASTANKVYSTYIAGHVKSGI